MYRVLDIELFQMCSKTAFLNGELDEKIYLEQSSGFEVKGNVYKVCHLKHWIYGVKQSYRQWSLKFHQAMSFVGLEILEKDFHMYV